MTSYYNNDSNYFVETSKLYKPIEKSEILNYDLKSLIDTEYYKKRSTKITARTQIYVRKAN